MDRQTIPLRTFNAKGSRPRFGAIQRGSSSSSLARMRAATIACALSLLSFCMMAMAQPAHAATWPVPTSGLSATLGFHQTYTAGSRSYVHSGVDIPASAGMQISSPLAGTVRFTGTVPSGDSKISDVATQRTMDAVSIEVQGGRVITLMPIASIRVSEGQAVEEGQCIGLLAPSGDASTPGTHLHMGYKEGGTYLDPMLLFGAPHERAAGQETDAGHAPVLDASPVPELEGLAAEPPASALQGAAQDSPALQGQYGQDALELESFGTIETGAYELRRRVGSGTSPADILNDSLSQLGAACSDQLAGMAEALSALSKGTGIPVQALFAALSVMTASSCALLGFAGVRYAVPYVRKVLRKCKVTGTYERTEKYSACH